MGVRVMTRRTFALTDGLDGRLVSERGLAALHDQGKLGVDGFEGLLRLFLGYHGTRPMMEGRRTNGGCVRREEIGEKSVVALSLEEARHTPVGAGRGHRRQETLSAFQIGKSSSRGMPKLGRQFGSIVRGS